MLVRRGFWPWPAPLDLPFPPDLPEPAQERLARRLHHYAFRLFLRGAIQRREGFAPPEATRYVAAEEAEAMARELVDISLADRLPDGRFRLRTPAHSFGGTLEWFVARELRRRLALDVAVGLKFGARGVGGDLDIVAAGEGRLLYLELKSSPPRNMEAPEVASFVARVRSLRPDVAVFVVDTALRLSDKVVPLVCEQMARGGEAPRPRRVVRELWALTPHVYAANAHPDLIGNIARVLAEGLRALAPPPP